MDLMTTQETMVRPLDAGTPLDSAPGGSSTRRIDDPMIDLSTQVVERAWSLKATMRWVRDDRNPLNAFRWFVRDSLGIGDPPSRVEAKSH
jgi:hypothetical protein